MTQCFQCGMWVTLEDLDDGDHCCEYFLSIRGFYEFSFTRYIYYVMD